MAQPIQIQDLLTKKKLSVVFERGDTKPHAIGVVEPSPCSQACPAGVNVKAYVSLIAAGRFREALEVVRERNPLPGICGRVCTHPCETACNRAEVDDPVAICWLKRFVADYELAHPQTKPEPIPCTRKEQVAIVGSGPAGLSAAHDLVHMGFRVTVFEALPVAGGMLVAGIPAYRLPRDIIQTEIEAIKHLGVEIKTNTPISGEGAIDKLFGKGFDAVFLAIGAHQGRKLGIPGEEENEGIIDCITLLNEVNLGKPKKPGDKVIVIGGGSSAVDSARTALRLGCEAVHIVYRRSRKEMPAHEAEIVEAEREGVQLHYLAAPVKVLGQDGKVTGMECQKMKLGAPDESGRRRPIPIEGSEFVVEADTIVTAISQSPDLSNFPGDQGIKITKWHTFDADEATMATSRPGVFAGGDAVTGPNTVIDAITAGHTAARSIVRYLNGEELVQEEFHGEPLEVEVRVDRKQREKMKRAEMPTLEVTARKHGFDEVDLGFSEDAAVAEARRCLRCGPCSECFICVPECGKLTTIITSADGQGENLFRMPKAYQTLWPDYHSTPVRLQAGSRKPVPFEVVPVVPWVQPELCRGCGDCVKVCEYEAVALETKANEVQIASVDLKTCRGCGACVAVCDTGAMVQGYHTQDWLVQRLRLLDPEQRNIVVFACQWNSSHPERQIFEGLENGTHVEMIHTMCSGRMNPGLVFQALEHGAAGVLITGCGSDECHYHFGARQAEQAFNTIQGLSRLLGISKERIRYEQIPRDHPSRFIECVEEFISALESSEAEHQKSASRPVS